MSSIRSTPALSASALALALTAALSSAAAPAAAAGEKMEKCFGVALKAANDCASGGSLSCAGSAKSDYQPEAWKNVPAGSCEKTPSPTSPTGYGQLKPFTPKKA
ncbi:MAG: hypothetical protein NVS9B10_23990 [Nevskia sp.]